MNPAMRAAMASNCSSTDCTGCSVLQRKEREGTSLGMRLF